MNKSDLISAMSDWPTNPSERDRNIIYSLLSLFPDGQMELENLLLLYYGPTRNVDIVRSIVRYTYTFKNILIDYKEDILIPRDNILRDAEKMFYQSDCREFLNTIYTSKKHNKIRRLTTVLKILNSEFK